MALKYYVFAKSKHTSRIHEACVELLQLKWSAVEKHLAEEHMLLKHNYLLSVILSVIVTLEELFFRCLQYLHIQLY